MPRNGPDNLSAARQAAFAEGRMDNDTKRKRRVRDLRNQILVRLVQLEINCGVKYMLALVDESLEGHDFRKDQDGSDCFKDLMESVYHVELTMLAHLLLARFGARRSALTAQVAALRTAGEWVAWQDRHVLSLVRSVSLDSTPFSKCASAGPSAESAALSTSAASTTSAVRGELCAPATAKVWTDSSFSVPLFQHPGNTEELAAPATITAPAANTAPAVSAAQGDQASRARDTAHFRALTAVG